jgi:RNA polymerase sigma factor (sigma-70 family)
VGRAAPPEDRLRAAVELLERHGPAFMRTARRVSICADDADDALQRATEILLTKAPTAEHRRLLGWMTVVTRHEAIAVRRARERVLGLSEAEPEVLIGGLVSEAPGPSERLERREYVDAARRALAALKADHRVAIVLQAEGYSYEEICELCGWTYTKVNRSLAEGRAQLRRLRAIS